MVRKPIPRLSKKKTGEMSLKDGKFKLEMKERWRFWVVIAGFFGFIFLMVAWILPWLIAGLALAYAVMIGIYTQAWRGITYVKNKAVGAAKWTGKWCVQQPIEDYRYGRRQRKDFERTKVYGQQKNP